MSEENLFVAGLLIGIIAMLLCVLTINAIDRNNVEHRARAALAETEIEPLTCKAIRKGRGAILTVEDGQLFLYYEDSAADNAGRLYSVRPK